MNETCNHNEYKKVYKESAKRCFLCGLIIHENPLFKCKICNNFFVCYM